MKKYRKVIAVILSICMAMSVTSIAFANIDNGETQMDNVNVSPRSIKTITGINDEYWDSHGVKFKFTVSANVVYDNNLGRYTMSSVTTARPENIYKAFSDVSATTTTSVVSFIDGNRTAVVRTTASIQNKTGYVDPKDVIIYVYCEGRDGSLSIGLQ